MRSQVRGTLHTALIFGYVKRTLRIICDYDYDFLRLCKIVHEGFEFFYTKFRGMKDKIDKCILQQLNNL